MNPNFLIKLKQFDDYVCSPFFIAASHGQKDVVKFLIDKIKNIDERTEDDFSPILIATTRGHEEIIKILLQKRSDLIDSKGFFGQTPLFFAVDRGNIEIVQFLINKGANLNIKNNLKLSPLALAICKDNKEIIQLL